MIATNLLIFKRKKVLLVTLSKKHNNLFCDVSVSSYKQDLLFKGLKRRFREFKFRNDFPAILEKSLEYFNYQKLVKFLKRDNFNRLRYNYRMKYLYKRKGLVFQRLFRKHNLQIATLKIQGLKRIKELSFSYRILLNEIIKLKKRNKRLKRRTRLNNPYLVHFKKKTIYSLFYSLKARKQRKKVRLAYVKRVKQQHFSKYLLSHDSKYKKAIRSVQNKKISAYLRRYRLFFHNFKNKITTDLPDLYISLKKKKLLYSRSNGSVGFKGPKRQTPFASEKLGLKIGRIVKKKKFANYTLIIILRNRITQNIRSFFRGFKRVHPRVYSIIPKFSIPHNRIRKRKSRRV
eukprot:TRINITY_DN3904_c0_g1_i1.p1 TRINITY_DN3904_c0_g1~~TRINITY_DN3904_c0_g1_i1.p1  ORF type:complete len:345 (-),score=-14.43 TRINITY_DN3904_c0_g1_i1:444-1478(-)